MSLIFPPSAFILHLSAFILHPLGTPMNLPNARNTMRQEGLLKDDSPHGTWEITDAGLARIKEGKQV